ncbi:MAG: nucleotidyltransferase domain-containing protein [Melioribacteraceae bacterium]
MSEKEIKNYLEENDNIIFAIFFGSYVQNNSVYYNDIDIGIYTKKSLSLLELGEIIAHLEIMTEKKIDIVELNNLYRKSPLLAYNIISNCKIIFVRDTSVFNQFKKLTFLFYFDTQRLIEEGRKSLLKRIGNNAFGRRKCLKD